MAPSGRGSTDPGGADRRHADFSDRRCPPVASAAAPPYLDAAVPVPQRVEDLLARMTLADKVGQMTQVERAALTPRPT